MPKGIKQQQPGNSDAQKRRAERLGTELRANLKKRKAAARDQRTAPLADSAAGQNGENDPVA